MSTAKCFSTSVWSNIRCRYSRRNSITTILKI